MTFSKHQQKLEHRSNAAYQGYKPVPGAKEALAWLLLGTVSSSGSFWPIQLIELLLPLLL